MLASHRFNDYKTPILQSFSSIGIDEARCHPGTFHTESNSKQPLVTEDKN